MPQLLDVGASLLALSAMASYRHKACFATPSIKSPVLLHYSVMASVLHAKDC
jgi:hypothetical protein